MFHVLNRAVARLTIFEKPADYAAFMRVLDETWQIVPLPIYAMVAITHTTRRVVPVISIRGVLSRFPFKAMSTC